MLSLCVNDCGEGGRRVDALGDPRRDGARWKSDPFTPLCRGKAVGLGVELACWGVSLHWRKPLPKVRGGDPAEQGRQKKEEPH